MSSYDIALSGMNAAQTAFDVIGNNIANAATEGYHKQRLVLSPVDHGLSLRTASGQGVAVEQVVRQIDTLMEQEILRQQSLLGRVDREAVTLSTLESALGELSSEGGGINAGIDAMFNALDDLSLHPWENIYQNQVLSEAEALSGQFRSLGETLTTVEDNLRLEAMTLVDRVNALTVQVAEMNVEIASSGTAGRQPNNMIDRRDEAISEISELIGISLQSRDGNVVDVTVNGIPLVIGGTAWELSATMAEDQTLGISVEGSSRVYTSLQGGSIGALLSLRNTIVKDIHTDLDSLATAIIQGINESHVQGVGSSGSFSDLTGWGNGSDTLSALGVSAGHTYIRVTDTATGAVTRTQVPVMQDAGSDTLTEVAAYITANVANVSASVDATNQVYLSAGAGYTFDFVPQVLPEPESGDISFSGTSDPAVSLGGVYAGTANDTYTFTVTGTGNVGVDAPLTLTVTNAAASTVAVLNIGSDYAAGDMVEIGQTGVTAALGVGDLVAGDSFSVDILADSDTSGLLAATGLNTFLAGTTAITMAVCSDIQSDPGRVASSLVSGQADNSNAVRMASARDTRIAALGNLTSGQFYRQLAANVGQDLSIKLVRKGGVEDILQNLTKQQSEISGVDINNEAAQLLVFEQMFQAMARYMSAVQTS
ncbi:MAG: flagellar hook-associated protein FlgK, partial [Planctomycetes bacterium]|nr:flagellar hook-associated protein FlgK [Planctomycetota bacterium]